MPTRRFRRIVVAVATVVASLGALVALPLATTQASAASTDSWSATGPGTVTVTDDGSSDGTPSFSYFYCSEAGGTQSSCTGDGAGQQSWTFEATAGQSETEVTGNYVWTGFHAFYDVTAELVPFVGQPPGSSALVDAGPVNCCTAPSSGFTYTGSYTFAGLTAGETYGFVLSGSNFDSNSQLRGTFTFQTGSVAAPAAPTGLSATAGVGEVGLSWSEPSPQSSGAAPTGYDVLVGSSSGSEALDENVTFDGTTAAVTALPDGSALLAGTSYYFEVEALDGAGASSPSNEVSATPGGYVANTSWLEAEPVSLTASGTSSTGTASPAQSIDEQGEALWYDFPVTPDEQVQVCLSNVPADYDLALFSDIGQAFTAESSTASLADLGAEAPGDAASPSAFSPSAFSPSAFSPSAFSPSAFSPSAFSPSAFSPSAFSPSAFSPSAFSPSAFSPSAFSPSAFGPSAFSPSAFSAAYSAAQVDSLLAVSTIPGAVDKCVNADSWNSTGNFYVRVTGDNGADAPLEDFALTVDTSGAECLSTLSQYASDTTITGSGSPETVIVDDSEEMSAVGSGGSLYTPLQDLAAATDGVVVDVGQSQRVVDLTAQAKSNATCPYAENLVADEIQSIVNSYRSPSLKYVVIVGDDDVIPFFRYPDESGLADESLYQPPLSSTSPAGSALASDEYLSDDQYGASSEITYEGTTIPLATAAVGRLVETPADILATVDSYLDGDTTIDATSTLSTGYDFMQPPATEVATAFAGGVPGGSNATLISEDGTPASQGWTTTDLASSLFGSHHDLVFLGGHFSANNLLAADDSTTMTTNQLASEVGTSLQGALVLAAGCHAGYNIDPADAVTGVTDTLAWPQAFSEAGATLIAGTGYQYGDTNYVAYSDEVYVELAQQLADQPAAGSGAIADPSADAVGTALLDAKLDYLAGLDQMNGIEEKALLEITLYGLPMLGVSEPGAQPVSPASGSSVSASAVGSGPGASLGLQDAPLDLDPSVTPQSVTPVSPGPSYTYDEGTKGVVADPGGPVLPLQLTDVNVTGETLRGVGFMGGSYTDTSGTNPLTGDPATDTGNSSVVPFSSPVLFPQTLWNPNYFPTLVNGGDTELAVTPEQYVSDPGGATTDTRRSYSNLDLQLYYSDNTQSYAGTTESGSSYTNTPYLAAAPTISDVTSTTSGDQVTVTATVTGDPSAGIQDVWVTYTGSSSSAPLYGSWQSVQLTQGSDSTQWTGTFTDADAATTSTDPSADSVFLVQAVNGVGEVSMDNNDGYFFTPAVTPGATPQQGANTYTLALGGASSGTYQGSVTVSATLAASSGDSSANVAGQPVDFELGGDILDATTGEDGTASVQVPLVEDPGSYTLSASYPGDSDDVGVGASEPFQVAPEATSLQLSVPSSGLTAGQTNGITATLDATGGSGSVALQDLPVYFVVSGANGDPVLTTSSATNAAGVASAPALQVPAADTGTNGSGYSITAYFGGPVPLPGGKTLDASVAGYQASTSSASGPVSFSAPPTIKITAPSEVTATGASTPVSYQASALNYDGSTATPSCAPASGSGLALGKTTISCSSTDAEGNSATESVSVDVLPAPLTLAVSGTQTYGTSPSFSFAPSGLVGGDTASVIKGSLSCSTSPATTSASRAGSYQIVACSGLSIPSYYAVTYSYGDLVIGQAPLTITASSATVPYGTAPPRVTPSYTGLVNGDKAPQTAPTCSTAAAATSQPGSYTASCSGASDPDYSPITYVAGTTTVTGSSMLLLGSQQGGVLAMSGQGTLEVRGDIALDSSASGSVNMSGQAKLKATGSLISPASRPLATSGQATVSVVSTKTLTAEADPDATLAAPSTTGLTVRSSTSLEGPGVYTHAVSIAGNSHVSLSSGVYVFDDGLTISGQAELSSASGGVLLYFAGGSLSVSGQAAVTLSPLGTGADSGISLFTARADDDGLILAGQGTVTLVGVVYTPAASVQGSGQATLSAGGLVAGSAEVTGQSGITVS